MVGEIGQAASQMLARQMGEYGLCDGHIDPFRGAAEGKIRIDAQIAPRQLGLEAEGADFLFVPRVEEGNAEVGSPIVSLVEVIDRAHPETQTAAAYVEQPLVRAQALVAKKRQLKRTKLVPQPSDDRSMLVGIDDAFHALLVVIG